MGEIRTHKDLDVWKYAIVLAKDVYSLTSSFPKAELHGLMSQMRRAAVSIASNIAEGAARNSRKEFIQFLYISLGSLAELETQLVLSVELGYCATYNHLEIERVRRMLLGLIKHLKSREAVR